MSAPRPNGFIRSKLKEDSKFAAILTKIEGLIVGKPNSFNVDFKGTKFVGEKMSNVDLTSDPDNITFTYDSVDYSLALDDVKIVKRIRCRKYMFKTNVLTTV